jgi:hypothetical protein
MEADSEINEAEHLALVISDLADKARSAGLPVIAHLLDMAQLEAREAVLRKREPFPELN